MRRELEWLGLEAALHKRFGIYPAGAAILAALARSRRPLDPAALATRVGTTLGSLRSNICFVREALADLGVATQIQFDRVDGGYRLSDGGADLWARVEMELAA